MRMTCDNHVMSMLQVRNLPEDLHARLGDRANRLGISMSEYVTRLLREDLDRPLVEDWATSMRSGPVREIDVVGGLDEAREEYAAVNDPQ